MPTPDADLAALLVASPQPISGSTTLVLGTNLFLGPVRPLTTDGIPALAVFVLGEGGPAPMPYLNNAGDYREDRVTITVRGEPDDLAGPQALARAIRRRLHRARPSGYIVILVQEGEPLYQGQDEQALHHWEHSFIAAWKDTGA